MNNLYIIVTENGIIKTASNMLEKALNRIGANIDDVENDTVIVDITTYKILTTSLDDWKKELKVNGIDSILEFSNKMLVEHTSGNVYEFPVTELIRHIDSVETANKWKDGLGLTKNICQDEDFDIEAMISNREE